VRAIVANLANCEQGNAEVGKERVRGPSGWAVGFVAPVCKVKAREDPVIAAVLGIVADEKRCTKSVSNSRFAKCMTHIRRVSF
jgi:hypothetical protein